MRRLVSLLVTLGIALTAMAWSQPAAAWRRWPVGPGAWAGPPWGPAPFAPFPAPLPYGTRFYYPSGVPLSYYEPETGTTYCLSRPAGFYYVCGYSRPARESVEPAAFTPPGMVPPRGEPGLPPPSGVLLFKLPQDAEATVNGVPVGLSAGLGITAVPPGRYRVVVRASGTETEHTITVDPHAILTVTPTSVVPAEP